MSNKHKVYKEYQGYTRCGVCDYSEMNEYLYKDFSGYDYDDMRKKKGRKFHYDKHKDEYVCEECYRAINDNLKELEGNNEDETFDPEIEELLKEYGLD